MMQSAMIPDELRSAVFGASRRNDVMQAIDAVYADLQAEIDRRRPICQLSGRCCRFEEYGHRLYVTTIELAAFVRHLGRPLPAATSTGCPFQIDKLCGAHAIRPFGCRIFFCDPTASQWQEEHYRIFHQRIRELHERSQVPYFYVEWGVALDALRRNDGINPSR
jgi:hypothetical protein